MTLNRQLLVVSLILLCLPWAGCQYLREMNGIMASTQQQTLMASSSAIAAVFTQHANLIHPPGLRYSDEFNRQRQPSALYFSPLPSTLWIDGYDEGWESTPATRYPHPTNQQEGLHLRTGLFKEHLYLLFEISDQEVVYNNPSKSLGDDGDRIILVTATTAYSLTTSAPGNLTAVILNGPLKGVRETTISAFWQDTDQGYTVEVQLPATLASSRLGFYSIDQDSDSSLHYGQLVPPNQTAPPYIYQPAPLNQQLSIFQQPGQRLSIVDPYRHTLAETGSLQTMDKVAGHWLIRKFYRLLLHANNEAYPAYNNEMIRNNDLKQALQGTNSSSWYRSPSHPDQHILSVTTPIKDNGQVIGALVAEQSSEKLTALSDSAFTHLLLLSFGAICLVAFSLLGYASWLSWRIRHLSSAANNIVSDDGKLLGKFPDSNATDEIGELTRNYGQLLQRIGDYTEYLQTLSRKLSHELRTPLAIIHTSLDNLANQPMDENSQVYQQRAKDGALRLGHILTAMSEASRVEESIANSDPEMVDIAGLLKSVTLAYQDVYRTKQIRLHIYPNSDKHSSTVLAVPDLLAQMLDKLVDNAASFCPSNGHIIVGFKVTPDSIMISVENDGVLLPAKMRSQLFDNMVSLRNDHQQTPHLGLGLHIVKLIVQSHNGRITANNRDDNSGVIFCVELPK